MKSEMFMAMLYSIGANMNIDALKMKKFRGKKWYNDIHHKGKKQKINRRNFK